MTLSVIGDHNALTYNGGKYDTEHGRVETWADSLGVWHASVPLTDSPRHDAWLAREALRDENEAREARNLNRRVIGVARERVTNHGTVVYVETLRH